MLTTYVDHGSRRGGARTMESGRRASLVHGTMTLLSLAALLLAIAPPVSAQRAPVPRQRAQLEQRLEQRIAEIERRELQLSPDQAERLAAARRQFEAERLPLLQRERQLRRALRSELQAGGAADQKRVDGHLSELLQLQRRRLDITEREQHALAAFLTPVQRARYLALQENLRNRLEQARDGARGGRAARPPG
jgi:hypothetical protein